MGQRSFDKKTEPVTFACNLVTIPDTNRKFELKENLLKKVSNENDHVDPADLSDKKLLFVFAKKMYFDEKASGSKSN